MGSNKSSTTNYSQTQSAAPPSWTMPGISDVANKVTQAVSQIPTNDNTLSNQIIDSYTSSANRAAGLADTVQGVLPSLLNQTNYDIQPVIDAALAPVYKQLTQQVLPGIKSSSLASGAYSGDRAMTVLPAMAISDYAKQAQDTAATIGYQDFLDKQNRQLQATSMLPDIVDTVMRMSSSGGDLLTRALDTQTQQAYAPFQGLDLATQLLTALSGGYGTQTGSGTSTTTQSSSGLGDVLQGAFGLASLAGGLGAFGPAGLVASSVANPASIMFGSQRTIPTATSVAA